jgi:cytochrome c553
MSPQRILRRLCQILTIGIGCGIGGQGAQRVCAKTDPERGRAIAVQVCAACHRDDGSGAAGIAPKLTAQHATYLYKQLVDYKTKPDAAAPARSSPVMAGFAAVLSEQDMQNVAAYFAAQRAVPGFAHDPDAVTLGQKIWRRGIENRGVPACAACHGPAGAGIPVQYPRLAGQWQDYTIAQLKAFRNGERHNNAAMQTIAARLLAPEIRAVADYIAGLR